MSHLLEWSVNQRLRRLICQMTKWIITSAILLLSATEIPIYSKVPLLTSTADMNLGHRKPPLKMFKSDGVD